MGLESGAVRWASGDWIPESDAGGGWESDAGLREQNKRENTSSSMLFN